MRPPITYTPQSDPDWYDCPHVAGFPTDDCPTLPGNPLVYVGDDAGPDDDEYEYVKIFTDENGRFLTTQQAQARVVLDLPTFEVLGDCYHDPISGRYRLDVYSVEQADPRFFEIGDPRRMSTCTVLRDFDTGTKIPAIV